MLNLNDCRFCNIVNEIYNYDEIDRPFISNSNFIAIASIGALVEGWSLIVPKNHQLSLKNSYTQPDFVEFANSLIPSLSNQYGNLIAFEHGSNHKGSITSCGTDHAHLHLVPFSVSLIPQMENSGLEWIQCRTSEINDIVTNNEYLFYCDLGIPNKWVDPIGYIHILENPISQYFRHLIADKLGLTDRFDYKRFPFFEVARQTSKVLADYNNLLEA